MPYPKITSQNYNNLGGINEKASEYTTQRTQFLKLFNVDFKVPNALTKRDGSTQLLAQGTSGTITNMFEYIKNDGSSYIFVSTDVGLFQKTGGTLTLGFSSANQFDFLTYNDQMWAANGETTLAYDGATFAEFAAPALFLIDGFSVIGEGNNAGFTGTGFNDVNYAVTYVKPNGQEIPNFFAEQRNNSPQIAVQTVYFRQGVGLFLGTSRSGASGILLEFQYPAQFTNLYPTFPIDTYNIAFLNIYRYAGNYLGPSSSENALNPDNYVFIDQIPFGQTQYVDRFGLTTFPNNSSYPNYQHPFWYTRAFSASFSSATFGTGNGVSLVYSPKYLELYNNSVFMSGFSAFPSRLWFSEIGEPETVFPENFIDIRTDDGDKITGIKAYLNQNVIFKENSFHRLTGDDSTNYTLTEVTNEYGCLNNFCTVEAENILYFLDSKGIVKYNGTSWILQSYPIEDTINRINIEAAKTEAFAIHKKQDNQVWFAVPLDDSQENNIILVYDYILDAWTFFDGLNASSFAVMKGDLDRRTVHFGSYSGMIHNFDSSLNGDNGQAITCLIGTRYEAAQGQNVQKMFRRLFTDINVESGASTIVNVQGFKDYNNLTAVYSATLNQGVFQQKKEFGISAKSMAFQFEHSSDTDNFQFNGYGVATRYLRDE